MWPPSIVSSGWWEVEVLTKSKCNHILLRLHTITLIRLMHVKVTNSDELNDTFRHGGPVTEAGPKVVGFPSAGPWLNVDCVGHSCGLPGLESHYTSSDSSSSLEQWRKGLPCTLLEPVFPRSTTNSVLSAHMGWKTKIQVQTLLKERGRSISAKPTTVLLPDLQVANLA